MVSRSASVKPASAVRAASSSICGQGRSGLTWSGVNGETPPQSSIPAEMTRAYSASIRLGGAWIRTRGPSTSRATAMVAISSSSSASGIRAIAVSGLARKFCTITSWTPPYCRAVRRIAKIESARSASVSPIPISTPVVNGIDDRPASSSTRSRTAGSLSGEPKWAPFLFSNRSREVVSSIIPIDGATGLSRAISCQLITPGFRCGSSPVRSSTAMAAARR